MRACSLCRSAMTVRQDDGTGKHQVCPPVRNREEYLAERARRLPNLVAHQERMLRGEPLFTDEGRRGQCQDEDSSELPGEGADPAGRSTPPGAESGDDRA